MASSNLVLRTVYLSPSIDDKLRDEAYFTRTSKNDLIRRYIEAGMKALSGKAGSESVVAKRPSAAKKAAPAKKAVPVKKVVAAKKVAVAKKAGLAGKARSAAKTAPARQSAAAKKPPSKKAASAHTAR